MIVWIEIIANGDQKKGKFNEYLESNTRLSL